MVKRMDATPSLSALAMSRIEVRDPQSYAANNSYPYNLATSAVLGSQHHDILDLRATEVGSSDTYDDEAMAIGRDSASKSQSPESSKPTNPFSNPIADTVPTPRNSSSNPRPLENFRILILNDEGFYIAYLTVADIVPVKAYGVAHVMSYAKLDFLDTVVSAQTGMDQVPGMMYCGKFVIRVENDVLLRFVLKEAYHTGQEALKLHMEA